MNATFTGRWLVGSLFALGKAGLRVLLDLPCSGEWLHLFLPTVMCTSLSAGIIEQCSMCVVHNLAMFVICVQLPFIALKSILICPTVYAENNVKTVPSAATGQMIQWNLECLVLRKQQQNYILGPVKKSYMKKNIGWIIFNFFTHLRSTYEHFR